MAFLSKVGRIFSQTSAHVTASSSMLQSIRCMSSSKIFVGGISYSTDEFGLREAFSKYGEVVDAKIIVDRETGRSRGFAFVTFTSTEEASNAMQLDGQDLHGRRIRVNYATERGGGFGGRGFGGPDGGNAGGYGAPAGGYGGGGYGGGGGGYGAPAGGYGGNSSYGGNAGGGGYGGNSSYGGNPVGGGYGANSSYGGNAVGGGYGGNSSSGGNPVGGGDYGSNFGGGYGVAGGVGGSDNFAQGSSTSAGFDEKFSSNEPLGNDTDHQLEGGEEQFGGSNNQFGDSENGKTENGFDQTDDGDDVAKRA
uniref:Glycine-rich RNA-binding protein 5, mitochondrial n=1 Tax=Noccaea caerulescens TaxID=107243 RepID=A0A1J3K9H4_NOCCA